MDHYYLALHKHFHEAPMDQNHTSNGRRNDANSVQNMGLVLHDFTELEYLSLKLQDRKFTLPEAHQLI
jgi:hypothetical protein